MATTVTIKEFAELSGVSVRAIYKAITAGTLIRAENGQLDMVNPDNRAYMSAERDPVSRKPAAVAGPVPIESGGQAPHPQQPQAQKGQLSKQDLDKLKTIAQVKQIQVKTDKDRKQLVSRDLVRMVFSRLYRVMVNQFQQLGPNVSPDVSAAFGIDDGEKMLASEEIINRAVFKTLQQVKRIIVDFLASVEAQPLDENE